MTNGRISQRGTIKYNKFALYFTVNIVQYVQYGNPHQIDWKGSKLLHINYNWNHRIAVESSFIKSFDNFNGMKSTLGIDQFSAQMVLQSISKLHPLNFSHVSLVPINVV